MGQQRGRVKGVKGQKARREGRGKKIEKDGKMWGYCSRADGVREAV